MRIGSVRERETDIEHKGMFILVSKLCLKVIYLACKVQSVAQRLPGKQIFILNLSVISVAFSLLCAANDLKVV